MSPARAKSPCETWRKVSFAFVSVGVPCRAEGGHHSLERGFLVRDNFDPMKGSYLTDIAQADLVEKNLQFTPNRTLLTSAHLQASNKLGTSADTSVASTRQRIWNWVTKEEIPNLYVMDSSMFPTSVGANPMQSIYTFAKIFSDRLIGGLDQPAPVAYERVAEEPRLLRPATLGTSARSTE